MFVRKDRRLKNYNYNGYGPYFITICTDNRQKLFGKIQDDKFVYYSTELENLFKNTYSKIENEFSGVKFNVECTMPDHVHFIISNASDGKYNLSDIVSRFKNLIYVDYKILVQNKFAPQYVDRFWQRDFYDHIIRNDKEMEDCYNYVENNPRAASFKILLKKWDREAEIEKQKLKNKNNHK